MPCRAHPAPTTCTACASRPSRACRPTARHAAVVVQTVAPGFDGYRHALWQVATRRRDASRGRLTLGARHDRHPRYSPDGRTLAFISDRRTLVEEDPTPTIATARSVRPASRSRGRRPGLPAAARRRRGAPADRPAAWRRRLRMVARRHAPRRRQHLPRRDPRRGRPPSRHRAPTRSPGTPPDSDYRFIDRLDYMLNGAGFTYDKVGHLWLVDVATGEASRLTDGPVAGPRARLVARRPPDRLQSRIDVATPTSSPSTATSTSWTSRRAPSRRSPAARGRCSSPRPGCPTAGRSRRSATGWRAARGAATTSGCSPRTARDATPIGGRNLSAPHDLMPGSGMSSDVTRGEGTGLVPSSGGRWLHFSAPIDGSYELWRIAVADGRVERLTHGQHYVSGWHAVPLRRRRAAGPGSPTCARAPTETARRVAARHRWLGAGSQAPPAPAHVAQRRRPRRARAADAGRAPLDGRWPRHPGLVPARGRRPAAARRRDPRRPAHALRLVASSGSSRSSPRPGSASSTATRAAPRATARRSTMRTTATGARARRATSWPAWTRSSPTGWPIPTGSASPAGRTAAT